MTKFRVLKLTATYDGRYAQYNGYTLLPPAALGTIIENLPLNEVIPDKVDLDELEGKHSECYANLLIEEIDLNSLDIVQLDSLIKNIDSGSFEIFMESSEYELRQEMKDSMDEFKKKQKQICEALRVEYNEHSFYQANKVARAFHLMLKEKYEDLGLVPIQVRKSQLEEAKKILKKHGIEIL